MKILSCLLSYLTRDIQPNIPIHTSIPTYTISSSKDYDCDFLMILFIFRETGREGERERNINVSLLLVCPSTGDMACNPGICPDWELNATLWFAACAQSTELHQPGLIVIFNSTVFQPKFRGGKF